MKVSVGVFLLSSAVIALVSGTLEQYYGYQGYQQNQVIFPHQVVTNRPILHQIAPGIPISSPVHAPVVSDQSKNTVEAFYDYIGLSRPDQWIGGSSELITNSHPLLTDAITAVRNVFRWFLRIPGIIFDGVMTLVRLPLTSIVLGTEGTVKFFKIIGQGIWEVFTYPVRFCLTIVKWFLGPIAVVFMPLSIIGNVISWVVSGLVHVFIVFPIQGMALLSVSMAVEAIHALRFIITTIVNLPLNAVVDFLSSEIAVLKWWG